eukprot:SAG11_NODE_2969_length_2803_cov_14.767012_2_plen_182_part_00
MCASHTTPALASVRCVQCNHDCANTIVHLAIRAAVRCFAATPRLIGTTLVTSHQIRGQYQMRHLTCHAIEMGADLFQSRVRVAGAVVVVYCVPIGLGASNQMPRLAVPAKEVCRKRAVRAVRQYRGVVSMPNNVPVVSVVNPHLPNRGVLVRQHEWAGTVCSGREFLTKGSSGMTPSGTSE